MSHLKKRIKPLIVIPAYNVENRIEKVIKQLDHYRELTIVIDDGSTDSTFDIINGLNVKTIRHSTNKGVSCAINSGLNYALENGFNAVIMMDADGQHSPKYLKEFIDGLNKYDMVFGNRFSCFEGIPNTKLASNTLASCLIKTVFNKYIPDVTCGYKAFWLNDDLLGKLKKTNNYSIVYELLNYAIDNELNIGYVRIPAIYYPSEIWCTKAIEIYSMLDTLKNRERFRDSNISTFIDRVKDSKNFDLRIAGVQFYGFYLKEYESYLIQADLESIIEFHRGSE